MLILTRPKHFLAHGQGLSQAAPLRQYGTAIKIVPYKNGQGDNLSPSQFREKTWKEAHTKRFRSVQKLQANAEHGKYIFITRLKFILKSRFSHALQNTYVPCSTKRGKCNWQSLKYQIENVFEH